MKHILIGCLFVLLGAITSCQKNNIPKNLNKVGMGSCIGSKKSNQTLKTCLSIETVNNEYIQFNHANAESCCESEQIKLKYEISNDTLYIQEIDQGPFTYCFCGRDINFSLGPFSQGAYVIQVIEPATSYSQDTFLISFQHGNNANETSCHEPEVY